jgi:hypothetical protein
MAIFGVISVVEGCYLTWWEMGLIVVSPIEMKEHPPVVNLGHGVNLFVELGPSIVLALLVCTYFRPLWAESRASEAYRYIVWFSKTSCDNQTSDLFLYCISSGLRKISTVQLKICIYAQLAKSFTFPSVYIITSNCTLEIGRFFIELSNPFQLIARFRFLVSCLPCTNNKHYYCDNESKQYYICEI